jgi:GTP-binding protein Era
LINTICGHKVSIVSKHPQTTRFVVRGIYNDTNSQLVFLDTPGYHNHNAMLNRGLSTLALQTLDEGDLVLYLVDASRLPGEEEMEIVQHLKEVEKRLIVVFNKIDIGEKKLAECSEIILKHLQPLATVTISALQDRNIEALISTIESNLPEGPLYYEKDFVTDQSIPFRIEEVVREKVFIKTREEVPHSVYISMESLEVTDEKITARAVIHVEKESQKGVIIGKGGIMIKSIGREAREDLVQVFERPVDLFLRVKVHHNWKKKENFIKNKFGL